MKKEGVRQTEELQRLIDLENAAKQAGKGKWGKDNPLVRRKGSINIILIGQ